MTLIDYSSAYGSWLLLSPNWSHYRNVSWPYHLTVSPFIALDPVIPLYHCLVIHLRTNHCLSSRCLLLIASRPQHQIISWPYHSIVQFVQFVIQLSHRLIMAPTSIILWPYHSIVSSSNGLTIYLIATY